MALTACGSGTSGSGPQTHGNCTPASATLTPYQGVDFNCSSGTGITLNGSNATYLIVPQFATGGIYSGLPYDTTTFQIERHGVRGVATVGAPSAGMVRAAAKFRNPRQVLFDARMQARGHLLAPKAAAAGARALAAPGRIAKQLTVGSTRTFWVFANVDATYYKQITATLAYDGSHVDLYVDNASPGGPPDGDFSSTQLNQFGAFADQVLYVLDTATYAAPTHINPDKHVIMLLTPAVNALTPTGECASEGYVAGYFDPNDLSPSSDTTNDGEIFYGIVPDPNQQYSCQHEVSDVVQVIPGTFLHEFQHMISWGQHVLIHGNPNGEEGWLDEGMSIVATELGARHYDSLFVSTGNSVYGDSALPYIEEQFDDSFTYLQDPDTASLTLHTDADCCLAWRGGDWLLMRYIGDQHGFGVYHNMEVSTSTGIANIVQATGQPFPLTFGNFAIAAYADSLPGVSRSAVPTQFQFASWDFRLDWQNFDGGFPISPIPLTGGTATTGTMVPGTSAYYQITTPSGASSVTVVFGTSTGAFSSNLNPQVMVFRTQ
jgi:hypothetical protein